MHVNLESLKFINLHAFYIKNFNGKLYELNKDKHGFIIFNIKKNKLFS